MITLSSPKEERAGERRPFLYGVLLPMNPWEHRTSNIQHPTSNTQHPTPNIQHPTANQWPNWKPLVVRCWMLGVGCFPSVHGFHARHFRGILSPVGQRFALAGFMVRMRDF